MLSREDNVKERDQEDLRSDELDRKLCSVESIPVALERDVKAGLDFDVPMKNGVIAAQPLKAFEDVLEL